MTTHQQNAVVDEQIGSVLNSVSTLQGQQLQAESCVDSNHYYDVAGEKIAHARDSIAMMQSEGTMIEPQFEDEFIKTRSAFMPPATAEISLQETNYRQMNGTRANQFAYENSIQESVLGEENTIDATETVRGSSIKNMTNASRYAGSQRAYKVMPLKQFGTSNNHPVSYKINVNRQRNKM